MNYELTIHNTQPRLTWTVPDVILIANLTETPGDVQMRIDQTPDNIATSYVQLWYADSLNQYGSNPLNGTFIMMIDSDGAGYATDNGILWDVGDAFHSWQLSLPSGPSAFSRYVYFKLVKDGVTMFSNTASVAGTVA